MWVKNKNWSKTNTSKTNNFRPLYVGQKPTPVIGTAVIATDFRPLYVGQKHKLFKKFAIEANNFPSPICGSKTVYTV